MADPKAKPEPSKRLDVAAFVLLIMGMFVATAILSHVPAAAADQQPSNLLGDVGAAIAQGLFESLGIAVCVLLLSWFVLVVALFLRRDMLRWSMRLAGWLILLPCSAILADQFGAELQSRSLAGAGGSLGAGLVRMLSDNLPAYGRILLFLGALALGIYLALDRVVLWSARATAKSIRWLVRRAAATSLAATATKFSGDCFPEARASVRGTACGRWRECPHFAFNRQFAADGRHVDSRQLRTAAGAPARRSGAISP